MHSDVLSYLPKFVSFGEKIVGLLLTSFLPFFFFFDVTNLFC